MHKLNYLNYADAKDISISKALSIETLDTNFEYEKLSKALISHFSFSHLHTFSFSKEGFLALMLELNADIVVSLGESEVIVQAAQKYESLGFNVRYIGLKADGTLDYDSIKDIKEEYFFVSSYIIDTFVKVDLKRVKELCSANIISNISATLDASFCDMAYFDIYKLSGYFTHSVLLHNDFFEEQNISNIDAIGIKIIWDIVSLKRKNISCKDKFIKALQEALKDDFIFFVDANLTLDNVVHFGLKGIKAREVIRNLSLNDIYVTNGEGCSLGLHRPSRILQAMGYTETQSRQALSLSFDKNLDDDEIFYLASKIAKSYRQIKALNE